MSLTRAITTFKTGDYDVTRPGAQSYTDGRLSTAAGSTFSIAASIQPYSNGSRLQPLPEGQYAKDVVVIYTTTELRSRPPDQVDYGSETYEVYAVETWEAPRTTHYRAYASRIATP